MHKYRFRIFACAFLTAALMLSTVTGTGALGVSQSDIDALERQKEEISAQKEETAGKMEELEQQQADALDRKAVLDENNTLTIQQIELITEQIDLYDDLIADKEVELTEAREQEAYQKERFRERVRSLEEMGDLGYAAFVLHATSFTDLLTRIDNISDIMESDKALEEKYIAARENVELVKAEYEQAQADQIEKRGELEEKQAELETQIAEAEQILIDLQEDIDAYRAELDANEAREQELQSQIDDMIAELERQQQSNPSYGGGVISGTGSYIWPLPGYSPGSAYGWRMHPILGEMRFHSGEDIGAPMGTPILAADSGNVILAGWNGGYGNCVMINHGDGRVTLYGHMSSIAVSYGQAVTQGQVIGYVGSTGLSTGPHLHFETHVNNATTDPKGYFNFG